MKTKIQIFLIALTVNTFLAGAYAQSPTIVSGSVISNQAPVEAASVYLLKAKDSSIVKAAVSAKNGAFTLPVLVNGHYLLAIEALGFQKQYSAAFEMKGAAFHMPVIELVAAGAALNGVTVTSKKPFVEQHLDKTIINVEASASNAGLSALDVLEKSPGISVDKDGNVSLKGKGGVLILVDGKPTYLSAAELANILKNMPSTNLEQIEIMPNPPAKYDAAGNSGVINIRTKKSRIVGLNGSVTIGGGMGLYPKTSNSASVNYRTGKVNVFANYSHYWNKNMQDLRLTRKFRDQDTKELVSNFDQQTKMIKNGQNHNFKVGADYAVTNKTTIGVVVNGMFNPRVNTNHNTTQISRPDGTIDSITVADNTYKNNFNSLGGNLNLRHVFDSTGRELTADIDYIQYQSEDKQTFRNTFYNNSWGKTRADEYMKGRLPSDIKIYSVKVDYTHPLPGNAKLEAGAKSSYVKTDNNALYDILNNGTGKWDADMGRSNHFLYKENINAAYVNLSKKWSDKWSSQLGVRAENTNANGNQVTTGETFDRHYTQLFPTVFVGFNPNAKNQLGLSYGRRIERPDYENMNPFYYFLDKYTYQVGNPNLRPQFSHNIELNHTWNGFLTSSVGYSRTNDIILDVLEQVDSITTSYQTKRNIASSYTFTASVSAGFPVTKWWKTNLYVQGNYRRFSGLLNNEYIAVGGPSMTANMSNQFQLSGTWSMELSGWIESRHIEGVLDMRAMGAANFAISKQILKKKGTLRLNVRDFLNVQAFRGSSKYQNVDITIYNQWDNRVVNLSFTYRFSKGQGATAQQRKRGGAGDEQNRVKEEN
ncbi:Outer membrane receptor proteins, mostly Fe transport [Filimonas lacunae]|uniref:Outer membrane receptor proteins, mostly Fe transport n=1 Tax=Filimonas lacunae TaxID=477680 RepID=A0A173MFS2_9BACT|nr:outer membrane beta-barrel family protein [Filimonas lacunae]BAV06346.1 TonB-dependent receptor [Filimonas lacunae]SIT26559.1 Outer membrane receptor proteins, mostly Fe transport [Filimonas lacunae]